MFGVELRDVRFRAEAILGVLCVCVVWNSLVPAWRMALTTLTDGQ